MRSFLKVLYKRCVEVWAIGCLPQCLKCGGIEHNILKETANSFLHKKHKDRIKALVTSLVFNSSPHKSEAFVQQIAQG